MEEIVSRLRQNYNNNPKPKELSWRRNQLQRLLKLLQENEQDWADAIFKDTRKPAQESIGMEVIYVSNCVKLALNKLKEWTADEYVEKNMLTYLDITYIHREPLGVVLILGAWNYPLQVVLAPLIGAIAAGNAVIAKPSELAPHTSDLMKKLFSTYMDTDYVQCVLGDIPETTELLKQKFDHICFTGSSNVGRIIASAAAKHLTPCTLELGGKSPLYLDSDVNMYYAAKRIIWGKMCCLGQSCVAPDYILCSEKVRDQFVVEVKKIYQEFFGEDDSKCKDLGRIINDKHFKRLENLLNRSKGQIIYGGEKLKSEDRFIDLTIVKDVKADDSLMKEELFGPILPIVTVQNEHEAAEFINAKEKPLSLYIFSRNKSVQDNLIQSTSSGSVCVNDVMVHLSIDTLPFGGVGESGYGAYHGFYTFKTFSHEKSVCKRDFSFLGEALGIVRYAPGSQKKLDWLKFLLNERKMPFQSKSFAVLAWISIGLGLGILLSQNCLQNGFRF